MATKLQSARKARGKTLAEVAAAVGVDPGNLSRIERGRQTPGVELARKLRDYYAPDISLLDILAPEDADNSAVSTEAA